MTARDYLDAGIAALLGEDRAGARDNFRQAAALDPGMCDAWMGLAFTGEISTDTLRRAHQSSTTLHRETRRLGLRDDELAPVVPAPAFLELYPYTPAGLALAYIAALIRDGDYDTAEKLLDDLDLAREPAQTQIHRFLGAAVHYLTRRWTDVLDWTARPVAAHNEVIDAATTLLAGIAHTGLGQFDTALAVLAPINPDVQPGPISAEAALYRGLCQRGLGREAEARAEFAAATIDGVLRPDAAAALADPTYGSTVTTAEAIAARTNRWDPDSGPSLGELRQAEERQAAQQVLQDAQDRLDRFIGLTAVKAHITELKNIQIYDQAMAARGIDVGPRESLHMTLVGPPGTAKTSVARIICEMYYGLGILQSREFIEVSRNDLVGQHIGETEAKTAAVLSTAVGRALFIDEAGDLYKPDLERDFGRNALDTIMKFAEDHRHDTLITLAGYAKPMNALLSANPGLRSRFPYQLEFVSNTPAEVTQIAELFAAEAFRVILDPAAVELFRGTAEWLCATPAHDEYGQHLVDVAGNGRYARNVIAAATAKMKARNASTLGLDLATADFDMVRTVTAADMDAAISTILASANIETPR